MFSSVAVVSVLAALVPQAAATLYVSQLYHAFTLNSGVFCWAAAHLRALIPLSPKITAPVATTSCTAGQNCQVSWNDDGTQPSLSSIG